VKRIPVRLECSVAIHAAGHVTPVSGRQRLACGGFEVEDVDGVGRACDDAVRVLCAGALRERARTEGMDASSGLPARNLRNSRRSDIFTPM